MKRRIRFLIVAVLFLSSTAWTQLDNILSPLRLPYVKNSKMVQISSFDTTGGNNDFIAIKPGAAAVLADVEGPGIIVHMWVTIASPDKYFLRRIVLRMYWDGEQNPSVEVPIGDFFGTGFQYKQYVTPTLGMSSGGYYSYFPMPFNKSARVEVVNETGMEINSFYYHIDYHKLNEPLDPAMAYFHAQWHREHRCDPAKNYTILEAEGEGHYVGTNMSMQSYEKGLQYLEGDEMVYVDGEKKPSLYGTGTEDYFISGWYFNRGEFAAPYHGLILKNDSLSRIAVYRFHLLDAIPFKNSIRFTIEHGHANTERADYSSTAYWYQKEPHKKFSPMMTAGLRIPLRVAVPNGALEAESLTPTNTKVKWEVEDMSAFGADWRGFKQLKINAQKEGEAFALNVPVVEARYNLSLYFTQGPMYGNVDVMNDGQRIAQIEGYNKEIVPGGKILLNNIKAVHREISLQFVVTGKNTSASGYAVGIDAFVADPARSFIPEWYLIGPFPNVRDANLTRLGLDTPYPPEKEFDPSKSYPGVDRKMIGWTLDQTPPNGRMDLYKYDPYEMVVVYAVTFVYSPKDQTLPLLLGTDDGAKVFLNEKEIHRVLTVRIGTPDEDYVPLQLKKGWNKLMLKIENNYGGYNFYARVVDPDETLIFSPKKEKP
jgi:hypothetical protein